MFDGTILLAGALSTGETIRAAQALGADGAYMGTRFISTQESQASEGYKQMCVTEKTGPPPTFLPTLYTDKISGIGANFLRASLVQAGMDPEALLDSKAPSVKEDFSKLDAGKDEDLKVHKASGKPWKDIWSAGQGVVNMEDIPPVSELVARLEVCFVSFLLPIGLSHFVYSLLRKH
jgi:nitronate monooxygenase